MKHEPITTLKINKNELKVTKSTIDQTGNESFRINITAMNSRKEIINLELNFTFADDVTPIEDETNNGRTEDTDGDSGDSKKG